MRSQWQRTEADAMNPGRYSQGSRAVDRWALMLPTLRGLPPSALNLTYRPGHHHVCADPPERPPGRPPRSR